MKTLFQSKKTVIAIVALALVVAIVPALIIGLAVGNNGKYRIVKVYETEGSVEICRDDGEPMTPYENMMLENRDVVKTLADGYLYLKLDEDKYLMAKPNSCFRLEATGTAEKSKTKIVIEYGEVMVHVTSPLSGSSDFTVDTGNSTMAIRGTSFSVGYDPEQSGAALYQIYDGQVEISVVGEKGKPVGDAVTLSEGKCIAVTTANGETSVGEVSDVDYNALDDSALSFIKFGMEQGNEMSGITAEDIDDMISGRENADPSAKQYKVTYMINGFVWYVRFVREGEKAPKPMYAPAMYGHWEYDFDTPVYSDVTVNWVTNHSK